MAAEDQKVCTLAEAMAEEGLVSLARATELIEQIVAALQAAQIRGRTHCHLEPLTILVSEPTEDTPGRGSRTKVIALAPRKDPLASPADGTDATTEIPALAIDDPAQQVALAAIAYEMLAGCSPFAEDQEGTQNREHRQRPPDQDPSRAAAGDVDRARELRTGPAPLSELVVGVPRGLDEVFRRALSPVPDQRFASLYDLVSTLRAIASAQLDADGAPEHGADADADAEPGARIDANKPMVADEHAPLRLSPPTGEATGWLTSAPDPGGSTTLPGQLAMATPPPIADIAYTADPRTPLVLASLPTTPQPSRRTQVSFLAAAIAIIIAAVGVMSGSRKKVSAEEPAVESTAAPIRPVVPSFPRPPLPAVPDPPATPAPPAAEPEASNDTARTTHRRSRRHAMHRPRAGRR